MPKEAVKPVIPQPVASIKIIVLDNGNVVVKDFPSNMDMTLNIMGMAYKAIAEKFVQAAMDGKLKKEPNNIIPVQNRIIRPN